MSKMIDCLKRILRWMQENNQQENFQPGLSVSEIKTKLKDLSFHLPQEVYELYQWRNGRPPDGDSYYSLVNMVFMTLDEAVQ